MKKSYKGARVLCNRFRLIKKIGQGSFGQIYTCEDMETHKHAAIKLEPAKSSGQQLPYEAKLYSTFSSCLNTPKCVFYGTDKVQNVLVMDLGGKSLESLLKSSRKPFSLKTVLMLATQMISALEFIHKKDYIHRDVKPDNFIMGRGDNASQVYIIDFGLSKRYRDAKTHKHIPYCDNKSLTGTARYASVNVLNGAESSRRDDMESLGYVWLYLLNGTLPWMGLGAAAERDAHYEAIRKKKESTPIEALCKGHPIEFIEYFEIVRSMNFEEEPKYSVLKDLFNRLFIREGFVWDWKYDWTDAVAHETKPSTPEKEEEVIEIKKPVMSKQVSKIVNATKRHKRNEEMSFSMKILNADFSNYFTKKRVITEKDESKEKAPIKKNKPKKKRSLK